LAREAAEAAREAFEQTDMLYGYEKEAKEGRANLENAAGAAGAFTTASTERAG
jgi:hypothetical protein